MEGRHWRENERPGMNDCFRSAAHVAEPTVCRCVFSPMEMGSPLSDNWGRFCHLPHFPPKPPVHLCATCLHPTCEEIPFQVVVDSFVFIWGILLITVHKRSLFSLYSTSNYGSKRKYFSLPNLDITNRPVRFINSSREEKWNRPVNARLCLRTRNIRTKEKSRTWT